MSIAVKETGFQCPGCRIRDEKLTRLESEAASLRQEVAYEKIRLVWSAVALEKCRQQRDFLLKEKGLPSAAYQMVTNGYDDEIDAILENGEETKEKT